MAIGASLATSMATLRAVPVGAAQIVPPDARYDINLETQRIHANGIVSNFWHDYQTMVLSRVMVGLEETSKPDC